MAISKAKTMVLTTSAVSLPALPAASRRRALRSNTGWSLSERAALAGMSASDAANACSGVGSEAAPWGLRSSLMRFLKSFAALNDGRVRRL